MAGPMKTKPKPDWEEMLVQLFLYVTRHNSYFLDVVQF